MEDRRTYKRRALPQTIPLHTANEKLFGHLVNLSNRGLSITGNGPFHKGAEIDLKMSLPERWAGVSEIDLTVHCCWHSDQQDNTTAGFRIVDITDTEAFVIQEVISNYGAPV